MKKIFITLALSLLCIGLYAHDFEVNGMYYNYSSEVSTECVVTYNSEKYALEEASYSTETVEIPETVSYGGKTYTVTSIGEGAFLNCSNVRKFIIPESITKIGKRAFIGCFPLTKLDDENYRNDTVIINCKIPPICEMSNPDAGYYEDKYNIFPQYPLALYYPPKGYEEAYSGVEPWNCLVEGWPHVETSISDISTQNVTISIEGSLINCSEQFQIYNLQGKNVTSQNGSLQAGVYIVVTELGTQKVLVK